MYYSTARQVAKDIAKLDNNWSFQQDLIVMAPIVWLVILAITTQIAASYLG